MPYKYIKNMLLKYQKSNPIRLHMPGHKGKVNPCDVTEISRTDNLNNPQNSILDALNALSKSYGSAYSFFMVNGATGAIHTMIKYAQLSSSNPILIFRNSHKSILSACMLFNIDTIILDNKYDNELQAFTFDEQQVLKIIEENEVSAVVLTPVDYFGRVMDVSRIAKLCNEKGVLLLCDEAHGSHYHVSELLPQSSIKYADICVHSPHKTLSALTQCAYVHVSEKIDVDKFKALMSSLQTSSPSFLLTESMDNARNDADSMKDDWERRTKQITELDEKLGSIDGIKICDKQWAQSAGYNDKDITRLVIDVSRIGSGIEIGKTLEQGYNIFMEMTDFKYLVGIMTPFDDDDWDEKLYSALCKIANNKCSKYEIPKYPKTYKMAVGAASALSKEWVKVLLEDAAGEIAVESMGAYPPGVPLVLPGEVIAKEIIDYMTEIVKLGGDVFGVSDGYINCIKQK